MFPDRRILGCAALVGALWLGFGCTKSENQPSPPTATGRTFTAEAEWIDLAGFQRRLAQEKGRVVVVNFWATWCEPCREEFPELIEFHRRYAGQGVTFLSVSLDSPKDRDTKVKQFLAEQRPSFPAFIKSAGDPDPFINAIDPRWTGELPATFLYDRSGQRRHSLFGKQSLASLETAVGRLL